MKFYTITPKYIEYLKQTDPKTPDHYNGKKPFLGIILTVNGFNYFAPLSSYKSKHDALKSSSPTLLKVYDKDDENNKLAIVQFNNMIPVPEGQFSLLNISREDQNYQNLLNKQISYLRTHKEKVIKKARKIHQLVTKNKNHHFQKVCCDFEKLEIACAAYTV